MRKNSSTPDGDTLTLDGETGPETRATQPPSSGLPLMNEHLDRLNALETSKRRRWLPAVFVVAVLIALGIALFLGVKALLLTSEAPDGAAEPVTPVIEEYVPVTPPEESSPEPVERDKYGAPIAQRVEIEPSDYPAPEVGCGTDALPRLNPFCDGIADRAMTDRHVANYMSFLAAGIVAPGTINAWPMSQDLTHWLRQVIATPVEDGGPDLEHEVEYLEILDRWHSGDVSTASSDYAFLRSVLDG